MKHREAGETIQEQIEWCKENYPNFRHCWNVVEDWLLERGYEIELVPAEDDEEE